VHSRTDEEGGVTWLVRSAESLTTFRPQGIGRQWFPHEGLEKSEVFSVYHGDLVSVGQR